MTEISNQFFANSNQFEMWKSSSNGGINNWENNSNGSNNNTANPLKSSGSILKSSTNSFQPSTTASTTTAASITTNNANASSTTSQQNTPTISSITQQFNSMGFDPLKVPSSIKNSQFINITSQSETNWLSQSDSLVQPPRRGLVKAYSEDNIQPPLSIQQQLASQQHQQDLENEKQSQQFHHLSQDDIEDEITGQNRYKTELCRSFAETGVCRYGLKCQFAHGRDELRPVMRHPKYKTEACKTFYSVGSCPYGSRCRFIHTRDPEMMNSLLASSSGNISPSSLNSISSSSGMVPPPSSSTQQQQQQPINPLPAQITPSIFANEILTKSLPQMIRQHSSPQLQTPLYILQQHKELQQKQKEEKEKKLASQQPPQSQSSSPSSSPSSSLSSEEKEQKTPTQSSSSHPTTVTWSNSWSSDEASSTAPKDSTNQLKSSAPVLKKEDSSKRLAIFKTICSSNSTW